MQLSMQPLAIHHQYMIERWMKSQSSSQPSSPELSRLVKEIRAHHLTERYLTYGEAGSKC